MKGPIMLLGGAGFLGRTVIRKAIREGWDASFTVYSRDETKQDELIRKYGGDIRIRCILGDIGDAEHLAAAMAGHETVLHMAAIKYIPEAERNRWEAVTVNVEGSRNVITAAHRAGVRTCIAISTDKAVEPVNTYGYTKALMEGLFAEAAARWTRGTAFASVRYGNVVGSTGSVIPLFARQLGEGKPITLTDARMTRFWLHPDAAVQLIENACEAAGVFPGAVFVEACPAMSIGNLALAVIASEGLSASWPSNITGRRPGEKISEDLLSNSETPRSINWMDGFAVLDYGKREHFNFANHATPEPYNSDSPRRWIGVEEMASWIIDARSI